MINTSEQVYIVRCGETALKGDNKSYFERLLVNKIKAALKDEKVISVDRVEGLILVRASLDTDPSAVLKKVGRVFGVDSISPATEICYEGMNPEETVNEIGKVASSMMQGLIDEKGIKTFKVEAKRADKNFAIESPKIAREVGACVLKGCKVLKVDVHEPEAIAWVNVRRNYAYVYEEKIMAYGGLPLGTNGKGLVLLSGGIDSPVATFLMAHRGMMVEAVHFHSYPYTSERAYEKVKDLAKILTTYCGRIKMTSINLLPIQEAIVMNCPEEETTILVRRFMMKIAERIAKKSDCQMLITGESLGQVASQTSDSLVVTDAAVSIPVMRPLIAMDKTQIIDIAREIGTFETSIQPFEDCCTVFLPKHPVTKPKLSKILESESKLDCEALIEAALENAESIVIKEA
ncbi:MAG: tRNA 4-thiouridine(8) synthase ThiI [Firmicutes bacterium]|nr:tRNA 4-thiouridine(8) synthase ThiI [Bacillota bacterium]